MAFRLCQPVLRSFVVGEEYFQAKSSYLLVMYPNLQDLSLEF